MKNRLYQKRLKTVRRFLAVLWPKPCFGPLRLRRAGNGTANAAAVDETEQYYLFLWNGVAGGFANSKRSHRPGRQQHVSGHGGGSARGRRGLHCGRGGATSSTRIVQANRIAGFFGSPY